MEWNIVKISSITGLILSGLCVLCLCLSCDSDSDNDGDLSAPIISDITTAATGETSTISWKTNESAKSSVDFGLTTEYGSSEGNDDLVTDHSVLITGLSPNTTYHYIIVSEDSAGNAGVSDDLTFLTGDPPDITPPAAPADVSGLAGSTRARILWSANTEGDLAGYNLYRRESSESDFSLLNGALLTADDAPEYLDEDLVNGLQYFYYLTAVDTAGNESEASSIVDITPGQDDLAPPDQPTGLAAVAETSEIELSWDANIEADLYEYKVYSKVSGSAAFAVLDITSIPSYLHADPVSEETYLYTVTAVDISDNESFPSEQVEASVAGSMGQ
jgi:fibronectin type 3 domain-containing protein